jgi:hypothetical protein
MKKLVGLAVAVISVATLAGTATASPSTHQATAGKKPVTSGFYRGRTIGYFDFGPIKLKPGNKLAPIWTVTNGARGQHNIIDTVPGRSDYTPLWQLSKVTFKPGVTAHLLRSRSDVEAARAHGEVTVVATTTVVNCPVLGFGQKRVAGFSAGKTIHYYDLGPVKVAPGNAICRSSRSPTVAPDSTTSPKTRSHPEPPTTRRSGESSTAPGQALRTSACSPRMRRSCRPSGPAS